MSSYDSMKDKLAPLRLYTLAQGSAADCELRAYACGLDPLFEALDEAQRESFIGTAESYGLSEREKFLEKEKTELSVAERRTLLMGSERESSDEATAAGFTRYLYNCGLTDFSVTELPTRLRFTVYINDDLDEGQKSLIGQKIAQASPAHLGAAVYFMDSTHIDI